MLALLLAAAIQQTAIEAERAFAADAQTIGQWAAFRKWAATDATMFVPQPTNAQAWLKDRAAPARAIERWPTASWQSCDRRVAVNTGGWRRPSGSVGYFTTVWVRQNDGSWRWTMHSDDTLATPRPTSTRPRVVHASCAGRPIIDVGGNVVFGDNSNDFYAARDQTLNAGWQIEPNGDRVFFVALWTGHGWRQVMEDRVHPS